jgi:hypothetical protein
MDFSEKTRDFTGFGGLFVLKLGMSTLVDTTSYVLRRNPLRVTLHEENRGS